MNPDFCALCLTTRIIDYDDKNRPFEMENYKEHFLELSNGSLLKVGIDKDCGITLISGSKIQKNAEKILENYKIFLRTIPGYPSDFESLEIVKANTDEKEYRMNKIREEMAEQSNLEMQKENHYKDVDEQESARLNEEKEREEFKKKHLEKEAQEKLQAESKSKLSQEKLDKELQKQRSKSIIFGL